MLDQEIYDTFEYDESDEIYEPIPLPSGVPPLPPARNRTKQATPKKALAVPNSAKQDFRNIKKSPPNSYPPPQILDYDENYEEFNCEDIQVNNVSPLSKKPPLPDRGLIEKPTEGLKPSNSLPKTILPETPSLIEVISARNNLKSAANMNRFSCSTLPTTKSLKSLKYPDTTKEKPIPPKKPSFVTEMSETLNNLSADGSSILFRKKSIPCQSNKVVGRSNEDVHPIPQPRAAQQDEDSDEDSREVYADACDVKLFLQNKPWYFGKLNRKTEEAMLKNINQNGAYLVRDSSHASITHPFTLTVLSNSHFYRLKIRHLESGKFVVGEKKDSEIEFNTVPELITYYQKEPLLLLATSNNSNSCTPLKYIPEKR